jgi:hypothetical protein
MRPLHYRGNSPLGPLAFFRTKRPSRLQPRTISSKVVPRRLIIRSLSIIRLAPSVYNDTAYFCSTLSL